VVKSCQAPMLHTEAFCSCMLFVDRNWTFPIKNPYIVGISGIIWTTLKKLNITTLIRSFGYAFDPKALFRPGKLVNAFALPGCYIN
jgi:hypothetical protein